MNAPQIRDEFNAKQSKNYKKYNIDKKYDIFTFIPYEGYKSYFEYYYLSINGSIISSSSSF
jgi:hypothetical protein